MLLNQGRIVKVKDGKIVIIANNSGGLYDFRNDLMKELLQRNNEIVALTPFDNKVKELKQLGVQLISTPLNRRGINPIEDIKLFFKYCSILKKESPNLVITYTIKPNIYGGLASRVLRLSYAANITGIGTAFQKENFVKKLVVFLYKLALKKAKAVFFENQGNLKLFVQEKIVKQDTCCLLNGAGVNLEEFLYKPYPTNEDIHFLFMGRIMKEKGIDELLWAARKIKEEYPTVQFDILGNMEDDYQDIIGKAIDEGIINYYGYQSDVRPFIEKCHCFVLPSYHEGMANTNLESAATGRPIITSNIHGCKEAVIENVSGYLVEKANSEELYQKIKQFLELSFEEKAKMALESRKHMEHVFDKKKVVGCTIKTLNEAE